MSIFIYQSNSKTGHRSVRFCIDRNQPPFHNKQVFTFDFSLEGAPGRMSENKKPLDYKQLLLYLILIPLCFIVALRGLGWAIKTIAPDLSLNIRNMIVDLIIAIPVFLIFRKTIRQGEKHILTVPRFLFCFL